MAGWSLLHPVLRWRRLLIHRVKIPGNAAAFVGGPQNSDFPVEPCEEMRREETVCPDVNVAVGCELRGGIEAAKYLW